MKPFNAYMDGRWSDVHNQQGDRVSAESCTLHVKNLDSHVSKERLQSAFGEYGNIKRIDIRSDRRPEGGLFAFVEFEDHDSAAKAFKALNKKLISNKNIDVSWAKPRTTERWWWNTQLVNQSTSHPSFGAEGNCIYVGGLSPEVEDKDLKRIFEQIGHVLSVKIIRDFDTNRPKGFGFVYFSNHEEAENAITHMNNQIISGRTVHINWAMHNPTESGGGKRPILAPQQTSDSGNTSIYVGHLPKETVETELVNAFKAFGRVVDVRHLEFQRYAFIKFDTKENAARAISNMNNANFMGQTIRCSWSRIDNECNVVRGTKMMAGGQMTAGGGSMTAGGSQYVAENQVQTAPMDFQRQQHCFANPGIVQQQQYYVDPEVAYQWQQYYWGLAAAGYPIYYY